MKMKEGFMGDKNPKQKQKLKKQHKEEINRKQAERQSHTHHSNPDGGDPNQHDANGHTNDPHQHKKAGWNSLFGVVHVNKIPPAFAGGIFLFGSRKLT